MAVKAVNNTAGPDKLVLILLVYRAYLQMSNLDPSAPSITDRAAVIRKVIAEIVKLQTKQTVNKALYYCNKLDTTSIHNLPLNSEVLIQRKSGNWTRPYRLLAIKGEICSIQLLNGPTSFRSTSVKPYFRSETSETARDVDPDKLKALLLTLEVSQEFIKPTKLKRG